MEQCFNNKSNEIEPLHISAKNDHYRKETNTAKEILHRYYMHVCLLSVNCRTHGLQSPLLMKGTKPRSCYQL
jgi:hypothetical protein